MQNKPYADVWGDTVNLRHLGFAMLIGLIISLTFYISGLHYLKVNFPKLPLDLMTAYALLIGIAGCLLSAVVSAKMFKPKRTLNEDIFSEDDREIVLNELQVDRIREGEELNMASPQIISEMKELQLYDLFVNKKVTQKSGE